MATQPFAILSELYQSESVRLLLSMVREDFAREILDYNGTADTFDGLDILSYKTELFSIRKALETIMHTRETLSQLWWWENIYRVEKLLLVAMCLERLNFRSLSSGKDPEPHHSPAYMSVLTEYIFKLKEDGFQKLQTNRDEAFTKYPILQIYIKGRM